MENKTHRYLIKLIRCAISNSEAEYEDVDFKKLYLLAHSNMVDNMIYPVLSRLEKFSSGPVEPLMRTAYYSAAAREAKQEIEAARIMEAFEKNGIEYMPLKGNIIKNLYPSPDMRQSTDFDIYVPFKFNEAARIVMDELGYEYDADSIGLGMHDNYHLGIAMEVEIHKSLMSPDFPKWCCMCEKILKNTPLADGYRYKYEFSKEDYYLYMQLHTIKHLKFSSCGMRSVIDIWVFLRHYNDILNWDYINNMLEDNGLTQIDKNLRALSSYWFDGVEPENKIVYALGEYIIDSGAFGTREQYLSGKKTDETKVERLKRMFFLPFDEMCIKYPILKRLPFLLPVMWLYRACYSAIYRRASAMEFINRGSDMPGDDARKLSDFKKEIGL